jgi:hypothetical protein
LGGRQLFYFRCLRMIRQTRPACVAARSFKASAIPLTIVPSPA